MKFGYRDRIILLVACVIIIFGIGIFVFIKPKYEKLKTDKERQHTMEGEWTTQLTKFEGIPKRQSSIEKKYKQAGEVAENFTDEMNGVELDQFLQEQFMNTEDHLDEEGKATVRLLDGLTVTDEMTSSMSYYYYTPSIVTYALYEYADLDGSLAEAAAKKREEADVLAARGSQIVGTGSSQFSLIINREDTMKFLDAVHAYAEEHSDAMLIRSVEFQDYHFNTVPGAETTGAAAGEAGEGASAEPATLNGATEGYTIVQVVYEVYYMQEPTKPDVGASYDPSVWETNAWREYGEAKAS